MSASNFVIFPSLWCPYLRFPIQLLRNRGRKIIPKKVQKSVKITQTKRVQKKCKTSAEKRAKENTDKKSALKSAQKSAYKKGTQKMAEKSAFKSAKNSKLLLKVP